MAESSGIEATTRRHRPSAGPEAAPAAVRGRPGLWSNRDFLKLWAGETVSLFGSEVTPLAFPLVAVLLLNATPFEVGLLNAAQFAPFLLLSLLAGVWVDRLPRKPLLVAVNLCSAVVVGVIPLLAALGSLHMVALYLVAFAAGSLAVFLHVGFWSYVPSLVAKEHLMEANSRLFASSSAAAIGGRSLGGLLIQTFTAAGALVVDAVTFLVAAISLLSIHRPEAPVAAPASRSLRAEVREGLRFVVRNRYLRALALEAGTFNFFYQAMMTAFLIYAVRELRMSPGLLGIVVAATAAGMLIGSLIARRVERGMGLGRAINFCMVLGCWPFLLVPVAGSPGPASGAVASAGVAALGFLVGGVGIGIAIVLVGTLRQSVTPTAMMGRMNASYRFLVWGCITLGALLGGALGGSIGLRATVAVGAVGVAIAPVWIFFSPLGKLRSFEEAAERSAG